MKSKALQVALWEFMEKVKSKAFIISLILDAGYYRGDGDITCGFCF